MKQYIIIGPARSGTTVTHLMLKGHPNVSALNDEVKILSLFQHAISSFTYGNDDEHETIYGPRKAYDFLSLLNCKINTKAAGIKTAVNSIVEIDTLLENINDYFDDICFIAVIREDILAQFGSALLAKKRKMFHSWNVSTKNDNVSITIDKGLYSRYLINNLQIINKIRSVSKKHNYIEISYENEILKNKLYHNRIYDFLGLDHIEPFWNISKKVAPPPERYINNYHHLKKLEKEICKKKKIIITPKYISFVIARYFYYKTLKPLQRLRVP